MAAVTVASSTQEVWGRHRIILAKLTAPADGDTWNTALKSIDLVQITPTGTTLAAADAFGVNSISGGTITFEIVGTARDLYVSVFGTATN